MPMNQIIQEKRKALGMTQEQVADFMGVSTPAVSKWETGQTCPDVSLLAPLARLLKTDVNTLVGFGEGTAPREIPQFCKKLENLARTEGIGAAFAAAEEELRLYPHHEPLLLSLTIVLDSLLIHAQLSGEEAEPYERRINMWYDRLSASKDKSICKSANSMQISRHTRRGDYARAQQLLNAMPDKHELGDYLPDKLMLQVNIYLRQGKADRAAEELQKALLTTMNKASLQMTKLAEAEKAAGNLDSAKMVTEKAEHMALLLGLWPFGAFSSSLTIAMEERDAPACIRLLRAMLEVLSAPCEMPPLFRRIKATMTHETSNRIFETMMEQMKKDPALEFVRSHPDFEALMEKYRSATEP